MPIAPKSAVHSASHCAALAGIFSWSWGIVTLGNALGHPPELAGCAGLSSFVGTLLYMQVAGQGITGMPFFNAPIESRILSGVPCLALNINMLLEALEGHVSLSFWIYYVAGVGFPQLMGAIRRAEGWMTPVLTP